MRAVRDCCTLNTIYISPPDDHDRDLWRPFRYISTVPGTLRGRFRPTLRRIEVNRLGCPTVIRTGCVGDRHLLAFSAAARPTMRILLPILTIAALGYVGLTLFLYLMQDRMLYLPSRTILETPGAHGLEYEEVWLDTEDGERLHAWWIPARRPRGVLLFCHGNAGNISNRMESIDVFNRLGLSVLIFDYRGYGRSSGSPSEKGLYQDAEAAWQHLVSDRSMPPADIIVFGRSLGAGVAMWLAVRHEPAALILESPFTSLADVAAVHYRIFPARLLVGTKYDNLSRISHVRAPVLINHATADEIIPFAHGMRLYEAAPEPKVLTRLDGRHNDGFFTTGNRYLEAVDRFLRKHVK